MVVFADLEKWKRFYVSAWSCPFLQSCKDWTCNKCIEWMKLGCRFVSGIALGDWMLIPLHAISIWIFAIDEMRGLEASIKWTGLLGRWSAIWSPIRNMTVSCNKLSGSHGRLPADISSVRCIDFTDITSPSWKVMSNRWYQSETCTMASRMSKYLSVPTTSLFLTCGGRMQSM